MPSNIDATLNAILAIESVADLDRVVDTAKERRKHLAAEFAGSLRIGDRVRIGRIKPRYIEGQTGVVAAPATGQRVQIRLEHPEAVNPRYLQEDGTVHVPTSVIELVTRAAEESTAEGGASEESGR
jgi:hypothetical protein